MSGTARYAGSCRATATAWEFGCCSTASTIRRPRRRRSDQAVGLRHGSRACANQTTSGSSPFMYCDRRVVALEIPRSLAALARSTASPLFGREARLPGEDDALLLGVDDERLRSWRVARSRDDRYRRQQVMAADDEPVFSSFELDPVEQCVLGLVRGFPLRFLGEDRDAGERFVLADMVEVQMAVDDGLDPVDRDARLRERRDDGPRRRLVLGYFCPSPPRCRYRTRPTDPQPRRRRRPRRRVHRTADRMAT